MDARLNGCAARDSTPNPRIRGHVALARPAPARVVPQLGHIDLAVLKRPPAGADTGGVPAPSGVCSRVDERLRALGPRHPEAARLYAAVMVMTATVAFLGSAALSDQASVALQVVATAVLSAVAMTLVVLPASRTAWLCVSTPLIGVAAIVVIDLATDDATVTGQVFFYLPVLYAATQLRPAGGVLVTLSAVAGEATVVLLLLPAGQAVVAMVHVGPTLVRTAVVLSRAGVIHDRLVAQLRRQAAIDPLTGLVTRRVLDEATRSAMTSVDAQVGTSLVLVDIDRFKAVNDTYGHVVGDDVLAHIAELLTGSSRTQDVVARMGGDEFAVLMPGCGHSVAARRAGDFVVLVRDTPLTLPDGTKVALSVSAGVANVPQHGARPRTLYASADAALYAAKHGGRGRVGQAPDDQSPPSDLRTGPAVESTERSGRSSRG